FRHMQEVIKRGNLFIAQPPLYKVTQGKKDTYLKDDVERSRFLLNRISESVTITPGGGMAIRGEALIGMLQRMEEYNAVARKLQARGLPMQATAVLMAQRFVDRSAFGDPDKMLAL